MKLMINQSEAEKLERNIGRIHRLKKAIQDENNSPERTMSLKKELDSRQYEIKQLTGEI